MARTPVPRLALALARLPVEHLLRRAPPRAARALASAPVQPLPLRTAGDGASLAAAALGVEVVSPGAAATPAPSRFAGVVSSLDKL